MFDNLYLKKGILYIILVHAISFISTLVVVLVLPKIFTVADYGYWQVYTLYTGYVGLAHFGVLDGIYLKLIGKVYKDIDKSELKTNFITQVIIQSLVSILFLIFSIFVFSGDRLIVFVFIAISVIIINIRTYFQYILQATGRIKEYSIIQISDRTSFIIIAIFLFALFKNYLALLFADVLSKIVLLLLSIFFCLDIVSEKTFSLFDKDSFIDSFNIGIKIMIANFCGSLLIGISKYFVDNNFSIEDYSKYSLSITFTSLFVSILASVGVVLLPYIKNKTVDVNKDIYIKLHTVVSLAIFFTMIFYYPISIVLTKWLPEYSLSFSLMSIMLPILYLECQFNFMDNIYLKSYRLEKKIMLNYIVSLIVVFVLTFFSVYFNNLEFIAFSLLLGFIVRNILCQIDIGKILNIKRKFIVIDNIFVPFLFVFSNAIIKNLFGMIVFVIFFIVYVIISLRNGQELFKYIKKNQLFGAKND